MPRYRSTSESDLALLRDTLEDVISASGDPTDQRYLEIKARASAALDDVRSRLSYASDASYYHTRQAILRADEYVHTSPWRGIGISATVGLVLGLLLARR